MATTFLEPGGDATFGAGTVAGSPNGFWAGGNGAPSVVSDFVHGTHAKSIRYIPAVSQNKLAPDNTVTDSGSRISIYFYIAALPTSTSTMFEVVLNGFVNFVVNIRLTSGGVLQLWNNNTTAQLGTNGSTLSTGVWYRLCLAYTIASTSVNEFRLFKDGILDISVTNGTLTRTGTGTFAVGNQAADTTFDFRSSDHYADNSSSLTDPGDIWVTAKRPNANGTLNQWTTQVGAGGSGYGSGHSPQVNERPTSSVNGWSIQNATTQTEEYSIEGRSVGDIDITNANVVDFLGWVSAKVGVNSVGNIIVAGVSSNLSITTSNKLFTRIAGSTTYPTGATDIGIDTNSVNQLFTLNEAGILVAFQPRVAPTFTASSMLGLLLTGIGT